MSFQSTLGGYVRHRLTLWERRRTRRYINSLPVEIQKDIGWPVGNDEYRSSLPERDSLWERRW